MTQNLPVLAAQRLNPANNFDRVFTLATGPPAPTFVQPNPDTGRFPLPNGIFARARPERMTLPTLDAWNATVAAPADTDYLGRGGLRRQQGDAHFHRLRAGLQRQRGAAGGRGQGLSTDQRRPYFGRFGWTQGIDLFGNSASSNYHALQTKATKRFSNGFSLLAHYTWSKAMNYDGSYFVHDAKLNYAPTDTDRTHTFVASTLWELPVGKGKRFLSDANRAVELIIGGWQLNQITTWSSGSPFFRATATATMTATPAPAARTSSAASTRAATATAGTRRRASRA